MEGEAAFLASLGGDEYDPAHQAQPLQEQEEEQQEQQDESLAAGQDEQEEEEEEEEEEEDDDDDYDPSSFMPDAPEEAVPSATPQPAVAPQAAASQQPEQQPPSDLPSQPPSQAPSRTASAQPNSATQAAQKPKAIGGFIEEDDDDDDDEEDSQNAIAHHGTNGNGDLAVASQSTPLRSPQASEAPAPSQLNTQVHNAPKDLDPPDVVPNGTASADSVSTPIPSAVQSQSIPAAASAAADVKAATPVPQSSFSSVPAPSSHLKPRLPQDQIGKLEDRIAEDPKGDINAWLELIALYRQKNKLEDARQVYERFFEVFPTAGEQWVAFANMELEIDDFFHLEQIFSKALLKNHNVQLWCIYLDYIRRRNNVMTDTTGTARNIINSGYEFVLNVVGIDKDSAPIWRDYINFIKDGPGNVGGTGWQDAQKMDTVRKAYQRAVTVPHALVQTLWKEYDLFETGLNKATGRKTLQEKSPAYMTARGAYTQLQNITKDLKRTTLPPLPPAPGFAGDEEFHQQVEIWQKWIQWEKEEDPVALKDEDIKAYRDRVIYAYRQAVMALRFWPQIWCDAAEWCYSEGMDAEGDDFLAQGIAANPESCLLCFKRADRIEQNLPNEEGEEGLKKKGDALREPYDTCLSAIYAMVNKTKEREPKNIAAVEEYYASLPPLSREPTPELKDEDDEDAGAKPQILTREAEKKKQIEAVKEGTKAQIKDLSKLLSNVWVALMRAFRRIQGKGKPDGLVLGLRGIFAEARKRGRLSSDVYVAAALLEHHCYKDISATKIFERGIKLFPDDEEFALEYLKHLIAINDITNARAVFETTVSKLASKPEGILKTRPLYLFMHDHESQYGDLSQITKLEKRMRDLFPSDPSLALFSRRFHNGTGEQTFNPCTFRSIISPATQLRPKSAYSNVPVASIEVPIPQPAAPPTVAATATQSSYLQSPKRPFDAGADSDVEQPARKLARGESPLKGAAGRRQQQRQRAEVYGGQSVQQAKPLPREVNVLLGIIPNASTWNAMLPKLDPARMVDIMRNIDLSRANVGGGAQAPAPSAYGGYSGGAPSAYGGQQAGAYAGYGYGR
ncbi:hypothetical protein AAFC00_006699 [Neodothiora populina]|uniref:mRNA 3'-end-processing protein RNA14 n=1 Tax=Neodothiora populina TaxID=2781224 RepID=A0ABR3PBJ7_9PEZI